MTDRQSIKTSVRVRSIAIVSCSCQSLPATLLDITSEISYHGCLFEAGAQLFQRHGHYR